MLFNYEVGPVVYVDIPAQHKYAVYNIIPSLGLPAVIGIDQPRPSLGSTKLMPRSSIHVHLDSTKITPMLMERMLQWLYHALTHFQAVVGHSGTMSSPTTMLLECASVEAGHIHGQLCWSILVISTRLLIIETRTDATTWQKELTKAWYQDPGTAGLKLRYWPSLLLKRPFAQVEATTSQIAAAKARHGHAATTPTPRDPRTLQASISISLSTCGPLMEWLPQFMQTVRVATNLPLQVSTAESGLDIHKWKPIMDFEGGWTGRILVQLATEQEVQQLHGLVHGKGLQVQRHMGDIEVESLHLDLDDRRYQAAQPTA